MIAIADPVIPLRHSARTGIEQGTSALLEISITVSAVLQRSGLKGRTQRFSIFGTEDEVEEGLGNHQKGVI
jgi:hypothetical protein